MTASASYLVRVQRVVAADGGGGGVGGKYSVDSVRFTTQKRGAEKLTAGVSEEALGDGGEGYAI